MGIRKALKAFSQMLDGRVGGDRRGSPRYSYNADSAGLVNGTGYSTCSWGVAFGVRGTRRSSSIQDDYVACIRDHLQQFIIIFTKYDSSRESWPLSNTCPVGLLLFRVRGIKGQSCESRSSYLHTTVTESKFLNLQVQTEIPRLRTIATIQIKDNYYKSRVPY